jgi:hypothetical protein
MVNGFKGVCNRARLQMVQTLSRFAVSCKAIGANFAIVGWPSSSYRWVAKTPVTVLAKIQKYFFSNPPNHMPPIFPA